MPVYFLFVVVEDSVFDVYIYTMPVMIIIMHFWTAVCLIIQCSSWIAHCA